MSSTTTFGSATRLYHRLIWTTTTKQPHLLSYPLTSNFLPLFNSKPIKFHSTFSPNKVQVMAKQSPSFKDDIPASSSDLQFEPPLKIVEYPDPRLRAKNKRIDTFDDNLKKLVEAMFDIMYKTDGIGLAAPQVGINVQLMVFNPVGEPDEGNEIVLINPRVSRSSQKMKVFEEGCLSFPKIYGDVQRPESIKIDANDLTGKRFSVTLSGLPARVFQHEFDHLQGILFFERMTDEVLDSIRADLQALEDKYEKVTGLPSPENIKNRTGRKMPVGFGKTPVGFGKS